MKAVFKGGLFLALGWLASGAGADDVQWKAATPKKADTSAAPAPGSRAITIGQPTQLDGDINRGPASFRPIGDSGAIIRAQAPDDKTVPPIPSLEINVGEGQPKPFPKEQGYTPPPPNPVAPSVAAPSPVFGPIGMGDDSPCGNVCGPRFGGFGGRDPDRGQFWASAEYLMWWQKGQSTPPLVTGTPPGSNAPIGVLPGASTLYNGAPDTIHEGGRFELGWWCPQFGNNLGIEVNYFFLARETTSETFGAGTGLDLGRPFFSVLNNANNAENFLGPDRTGNASINTYSELWGIEANLRYKLLRGDNWWIDALAGYRYAELSEGINIQENLTLTKGAFAGTGFSENESFHTRNIFNGGQVGLEGEFRLWNRWFLGWDAKTALGDMHEITEIDGNTTRTLPGGPSVTVPGALLATQTNIGRYTQDRFGLVQEVGLKIGYDLTRNLRVFAGYDFFYMSDVVRPGDQIDTRVNSDLRPFTGNTTSNFARVPTPLNATSNYWAQGLNFGVMYRY